MILVKIIIIALLGTVCAILVKPFKPEISIFLIIVSGLLILFQVLDYFVEIIETFTRLSEQTGIDNELFKIILKIIGVGYLIEFASNICIDSGMNSIASKIQFAGKVIILFLSLPIINMLIEIITQILQLC